jgi:hypothetical protein
MPKDISPLAGDLHKIQKLINDKLERTAIGMTLRLGDSIEFSNGTTVIYKQKKGSNQAMLVVLAPKEVRAYRPKKGASHEGNVDGQSDQDSGQAG